MSELPTSSTPQEPVAVAPQSVAPASVPATASTTSAVLSNKVSVSAGSKRPLKTRNQDGEQLSEKKLRRLEKNRLSARECRRRKREATENLERQINVLEGENLRLRLQLQIGEEAEESMRQEQERLTEEIDDSLKSGASETEIYATIEEFKEKFADYGRDRRSAIEFHLRNVERLLMPTQTTSVAMRALHGGSNTTTNTAVGSSGATSFPVAAAVASLPGSGTPLLPPLGQPVSPTSTASAGSSDTAIDSVFPVSNPALEPKAMFQYLVNYLGVTPEQAAALKDSRWVAHELDQILAKSLTVLDELRSRLIKCGEDLETEFNNVRAILTPTQAAKFVVWVANNGACMHMLNELWSRSYPKAPLGSAAEEEESEASP